MHLGPSIPLVRLAPVRVLSEMAAGDCIKRQRFHLTVVWCEVLNEDAYELS